MFLPLGVAEDNSRMFSKGQEDGQSRFTPQDTGSFLIPGSPAAKVKGWLDDGIMADIYGWPVDATATGMRGIGFNVGTSPFGGTDSWRDWLGLPSRGGRLASHPISTDYTAPAEASAPSLPAPQQGILQGEGGRPLLKLQGVKDDSYEGIRVIDEYLAKHERYTSEGVLRRMKEKGIPVEAFPEMMKRAQAAAGSLPPLQQLQQTKMLLQSPAIARLFGHKPEEKADKDAWDRFQPLYTKYLDLQKEMAKLEKGVDSTGLKMDEGTANQAKLRLQEQLQALHNGMSSDAKIAKMAQMYLGLAMPKGMEEQDPAGMGYTGNINPFNLPQPSATKAGGK